MVSSKRTQSSENGKVQRKARVLIVEDDPSIVFGIERNLIFEGFEVVVATSGAEGLEKALDPKVDLIILDIMLPEMNGYEICQTIRKHGLKTPVIFLSAKVQEIDKVNGLELGGDDYMTKPTHPAELASRMKALLALSTQTRAARSERGKNLRRHQRESRPWRE